MIRLSRHPGKARVKPILAVIACVLAIVALVLATPINLGNLQALHTLASGAKNNQPPPAQAMPYLRGLVNQMDGSSAAQQEFTQALHTRHAPFAAAHLVEVWLSAGQYDNILGFLESGPQLDFELARVVIPKAVPSVASADDVRWLAVVQGRYPKVTLLAAQELMRQGKYDRALRWADAVDQPAQQMEAALTAGICHFYLGHLEQALARFKTSYTLAQTADTSYWYGRLLMLMGNPQQAIPVLETSARLSTSGMLPWALRELGSAYALAGRCADASAAFDRSLHSDASADNVERIRAARANVVGQCDTP